MMPATIAEAIKSSNIEFSVLEESPYKPMLGLVRELIGVVPNCDQVLEIWPTGFKSYNLIVPTLLDLPKTIFGKGAPKDLLSLGMYISSRAADCMYCSAHTCSFALRRGTSAEALSGEDRSPVETAVVKLAEGLSFLPASASVDDVKELQKHLSMKDVDGVAMGIVMMGFLNKFMDAMGIGLEAGAIDDVEDLISSTGWSVGQHGWNDGAETELTREMSVDSATTYVRVVRHGPAATKLEKKWTRKFSGEPGRDAEDLHKQYGADYGPILRGLNNPRLIKAISTVLDENLSPKTRTIDLELKGKAALIFASLAQNEYLAEQAKALIEQANPRISPAELQGIVDGDTGGDPVLDLAVAFAPSPAEVSPELVESTVDALTHTQIVELGVWISIQQMLHRLERYRALTDQL